MQGIIARFRNGGFAFNVLLLAGGTAIGQAIGVAVLPFLTRLYSPEAFGSAATFAAIIGLLTVVASARYEMAIPLPKRDGAALSVAALAGLILVAVSLACALMAIIFVPYLSKPVALPDWLFIALLVIGLVSAGLYNIASYWAVRKSMFAALSWTRVHQGAAGAGAQLILGFVGSGALGLILGQVIGQCVGIWRLVSSAFKVRGGQAASKNGMRWAALRYRRFPQYDLAAGLLNVASGQAPVLLFAAAFSPALAGAYAVAYRLLAAPNSLVGRAVGQALLPRIAANRADAADLVAKCTALLAWLSAFPFTVAAVFSQTIVPLAFGKEWSEWGFVFGWTAAWVGWQFVCSPISTALIGLERQRLNTILQLFLFVTRLSSIAVGIWAASAELAMIAFAVGSSAAYFVYIYGTARAAGVTHSRFAKSLLPPVAFAVVAAAVISATHSFPIAQLGIAAVFGIVWLVLLYVLGKRPRGGFLR